MKKTTEKNNRQVMDGEKDGEPKPDEVKSGKKMKRPRATHQKTSESGNRSSGETERMTEESRTGEWRDGERKTRQGKSRKEKGTDVSGDGGTPGEKRARTGSGVENRQEVKESQVMKKRQESKQNVRVWSVSYSSTVDVNGGDKKLGTHRRERDEVDKCSGLVQTLSTHSSDEDQYVSWVQCSKPECGKWRRLSDGVDPSVLPDDWSCKNNTDPAFSSCFAPEEKSSVPDEEMFFYSLVPGSLVWAQQSGYPWWPAIVERDPNTEEYLEFRTESDLTPYRCHVTYFGEPVSRAWVICSRVRFYADLSEDQFLSEVDKGLKDAIYMAKEALKLSLKERLVKFGFHSRYVSDRESSEDSDIAEMLELFCGEAGNDCSVEDSWGKKQRLKQKERKSERKRSGQGKEDHHMYGEGEKKKRAKKKLKEGTEDEKEKKVVISGVPVKKKKRLSPSLSLPKKKKQHKTDTADQTVPQSTMETSTDMTFDLDIHSEGEEMERKIDRVKLVAEEKERKVGEGREDEDEDDEEFKDAPDREEEEDEEENQDSFSHMLLQEE
ncbi:zinc finger CW-type PWWP domain protein 1-like isoform X1 [Ictalurus furcatus]|uniref:zinc finger CW-type PWWP domain protein 1-like isoform X1 n=1 Tax=Ictalurus furcatus TaxID=66913 RepID=UPI00235046D7|nr:zinc finger CW-type PWWP domain protein 1-like isoform X1 [Ictalurus furcatus]XP_053500397.1 zinc finger CW-type PWWP domain protein 1-like isoform X1 [Ictalurus furcatus]